MSSHREHGFNVPSTTVSFVSLWKGRTDRIRYFRCEENWGKILIYSFLTAISSVLRRIFFAPAAADTMILPTDGDKTDTNRVFTVYLMNYQDKANDKLLALASFFLTLITN